MAGGNRRERQTMSVCPDMGGFVDEAGLRAVTEVDGDMEVSHGGCVRGLCCWRQVMI